MLASPEVSNELKHFIQTSEYAVAAVEGVLAEKQIEYRVITVLAGAPVGIGHGHLVHVGQQRTHQIARWCERWDGGAHGAC